jgi:hypothetical protein
MMSGCRPTNSCASARAVKPRDDAAYDGVGQVRKDDWDRPRLPLDGNGRRGRGCQDDVGLQADQFLRGRSYPIGVIAAPTKVYPHVAAVGPTRVRKCLSERRVATLPFRIVFVGPHEHADPPHAAALLRPCRDGQTAAPPSPAINSRRFIVIRSPRRRGA